MKKAILSTVIFSASFGLMMVGILLAIHSEYTWTGLMVSFAGLVSFWNLLPEVNRYE